MRVGDKRWVTKEGAHLLWGENALTQQIELTSNWPGGLFRYKCHPNCPDFMQGYVSIDFLNLHTTDIQVKDNRRNLKKQLRRRKN